MDFSDLIPGEPTDKSIGININGIETEVPAEVRGLTPEETALVRSKLPTNQWPKAVLDKIEGSARDKLELGLSPFDTDGSQPAPPEHLSAGSGSAISQPSYSPTPRGQDSNDPTDLQGREREGGSMTPDELDRLWQAQQRRNEEARGNGVP